MFTGIVETTGKISSIRDDDGVTRLTVASELDTQEVKLGDSIAINGVCLTVTQIQNGMLSFDVGPESLRVTSLGDLKMGSAVHMERALALNGRLDGHLVQGHVDGTGEILQTRNHGDTFELEIGASDEVLDLCIPKGSITIDGVSLTINNLHENSFDVWLVPHTLDITHLGNKKAGDRVNLENDLIGKYVQRLLSRQAKGGQVTLETLKNAGFIDT